MVFICDVPKKYCNLRMQYNTCRLERRCEKVVDKCLENGGCIKIENEYCKAYTRPSVKWLGKTPCPLASNVVKEKSSAGKVRVGQQKQRKIKH